MKQLEEDNVSIESFHATIKKEEVYQKRYFTFKEAHIQLFQFHGSIG
ncbi:MAG: hypothetical protein LBF97_07895 [Elusimicrobiota bacterium]|nr:hypothetical protein [Elusimicrobiota bacterium]